MFTPTSQGRVVGSEACLVQSKERHRDLCELAHPQKRWLEGGGAGEGRRRREGERDREREGDGDGRDDEPYPCRSGEMRLTVNPSFRSFQQLLYAVVSLSIGLLVDLYYFHILRLCICAMPPVPFSGYCTYLRALFVRC